MNIKAIAFDTGGTVLDWHSGVCQVFSEIGTSHGLDRDWHVVTNDYRRLAMQGIVGQVKPPFNMDDIHRCCLVQVLADHGLQAFTSEERSRVADAWHNLSAWPDFPMALSQMRSRYPVVSFTMLPLALVVNVSRRNCVIWDAVISCEMIATYKPHPQAYMRAASWMNLKPSEILMVACHNFDLNAARECGFRTAFVRRPQEWGPQGPPDPTPHPDCDIVVDNFVALARCLLEQ
ncbi:haloacid dehalogenase type II [Acidovorax delafieldii]|uniref:haloacid dehalogenase type II n=1 Tax=Acidovorax delafieldii TaxID=47920 RepID=UPI003ECD551D